MDKQWTGKWIMDRRFGSLAPLQVYHKEAEEENSTLRDHSKELQGLHMLVRKSVRLDAGCREAWLDLTADDYYKLYINGQFVGQGPAQGNYYHYFYNRYNVASHLRQGENIIAVHVYYHGLISRSYNSGDYRQGLIAELRVDGRITAATDGTWKYTQAEEYQAGEIIGYNTQFLENIDARLQLKGWREPGFDDSMWESVQLHEADEHELFIQPTPVLSVTKRQPRQVTPIEGGLLLDFGTELTGQLAVRAAGPAGAVVELRCGEELLDNGRVRYNMRCNCTYRDIWTLSGGEDELELYDYKAFRYAEILAGPEVKLDRDSLGAIVRHYPLAEDACRFDSSSPLLNGIWRICKDGVKYGTQENYVDCPSREKGQYLGDNTIITHAHGYLSGDLRMVRKAIEDFALLSRSVCPGLMAVAPGHLMQEIADFSLQWPMQLLQYYMQSGDLEFLKAMHPVAQGVMDYFSAFQRPDGLLDSVNDKWNLVDWPENLRDGYDFPLIRGNTPGCHNVINAFYYGALEALGQIRRQLQLPDCGEDREAFRQAFLRQFYQPDKGLFVDAEGSLHSSLHANVLPLLFGLAPEESVPSVIALIREKRLSCGVYMAYFVLKAVAAADEYELLYELITSDDLHSWSNMLKEGATTCFEAWSKELKWNTSLCHPWASAPIPLLIEEIIGLKPLSPGWKHIRFQPRIPESLQRLELSFRVPDGEIRFAYNNGSITLNVPEGCQLVR